MARGVGVRKVKKVKKAKKRPPSIDQQAELFRLPEDTPKVQPEGQQPTFPKPLAPNPLQPQENDLAPDLDVPPAERSQSSAKSNAPLGDLALQDSEGINGDVEIEDDDFDYEDAQI